MSQLSFTIAEIFAERYAVAPQLTARLRVEESTGTIVHAAALRAQVRIEPQRRHYTTDEERALLDLFGPRERWYDTLKPFLWMQTSAMVQGFTGITELELPLPCTYDFDVTASKYLHALDAGGVSVVLLFSGTLFTRGERGFGVEQIPWDCEARYDMPVAVWHELIERYYPGTGWIRLDRELIEKLAAYKTRNSLLTWDETVVALLPDPDRSLS